MKTNKTKSKFHKLRGKQYLKFETKNITNELIEGQIKRFEKEILILKHCIMQLKKQLK